MSSPLEEFQALIAPKPSEGFVTPSATVKPLVPGNINLLDRPHVQNPDGGVSSLLSASFGTDQGEVLVPRVMDDGTIVTDEQAIEQYRKTGRHLGIFKNPAEADAYAKSAHNDGASMMGFDGGQTPMGAALNRGTQPSPGGARSMTDAVKNLADQGRLEQGNWGKILEFQASSDTASPGERADVLRYSAATGMTPDYVQKNLKAVKAQADYEGVDWNMVARTHPELAKMLVENPALMPVVKDDVANLGTIEWALKAPFAVLWDGLHQQETIARQDLEAFGLGGAKNRQAIDQLEAQYGAKDYGASSLPAKMYLGIFKGLPFIAGNVLAAQLGGAVGAALGGGAGTAAGLEAGPGAAVTGGVGALGGVALGPALGMFAFNYLESVGPLHDRLTKLRDAEGKPLDPAVIQAFTHLGAGAQGLLFAGLGGQLTKFIPKEDLSGFTKVLSGISPFGKEAIARLGMSATEKVISEEIVSGTAKKFAARYGSHLLSGIGLMAAQSGFNQAAEESAKAVQGGDFSANWGNVVDAMGSGALAGFQDLALLSAYEPFRSHITDVGRARASAENVARLSEAVKGVQDSETMKRAPFIVQRLAQMAQGEDGPNVLFPVKDWDAFFKARGLDPAEAAKLYAGDNGEAYQLAQDTDGHVAIPKPQFMTKMAPHPEIGKDILMDATLSQDVPTARQLKTILDEQVKKTESEAGEVPWSERPENKTQLDHVYETVRDAAIKGGVQQAEARAVATFYRTTSEVWAQRTGATPASIVAKTGLHLLRIRGVDAEADEAVSKLQAGDEVALSQGVKGARTAGRLRYSIGAEGNFQDFGIELFSGRNPSTFLHETGHLLSMAMHNLAQSDIATPEIKADYGKLLAFGGWDSAEHRIAESKERTALQGKIKAAAEGRGTVTDAERLRFRALSAKEERISHAFEAYVRRGVAPSEEMRPVFQRMKGWLKQVYEKIGTPGYRFQRFYKEELRVSPEIRDVFDRMLATDEARAESEQMLKPDKAAMEAMTDAQRERYVQGLKDAHAEMEEGIARRADEIEQQRMGPVRAAAEAEATAEVDKAPLYKAMRFLQHGELPLDDGTVLSGKGIPAGLKENGAPLKLDSEDFINKYGKDKRSKMPDGVFAGKKGSGETADRIAAELGFMSGKDLVEAMTKAKSRDALIEEKTQKKLDDKYGTVVEALHKAALDAADSDKMAEAGLAENRALSRTLDPKSRLRQTSTSLDTMKATAKRLVEDMPVNQLGKKARGFLQRAQQLLKDSSVMWGAGDKETALALREARVMNLLLYRQARDMAEQVANAKVRGANLSRQQEGDLGLATQRVDDHGNISNKFELRDAYALIRGAVGLGPRVNAGSLRDALDFAKSKSFEVDFDTDTVARVIANGTPWDSLSASDALTVSDAMSQLKRWALLSNRVRIRGKLVEKSELIESVRATAAAGGKSLPPEPFDPHSGGGPNDGVGGFLRAFGAEVFNMRYFAWRLDRGDRNGPMHDLLVDQRLEAEAAANTLRSKVQEKFMAMLDNLPSDMRRLRDEDIPELRSLLPVPASKENRISNPDSRSTIWMLFLHYGQKDGRRWLREGMGWTDGNMQQALNMLSDKEATFLQGILDTFESEFYPELKRVQEERKGLELPKVQAESIQINGKNYRGGYFPLRKDPRFNIEHSTDPNASESLFDSGYKVASVSSPHRKDRLEDSVEVPNLQWGMVRAHVEQVIHDVSHGDWVRRAGNVLLDPRFKDIVASQMGDAWNKAAFSWIHDVANNRADSLAGAQSEFMQKWSPKMRARMSMMVLGFNFKNQLQALTDALRAPLVGGSLTRMGLNYVRTLTDWNWEGFKDSRELPQHGHNIIEQMRKWFADSDPNTEHGRFTRAIMNTAFRFYAMSDAYTTRVVYRTVKETQLAKGLSMVEANRMADDAVEQLFAKYTLAEKPSILRSKRGLGTVLMFNTWANKNLNLLAMTPPGHSAASYAAHLAARAMFYSMTGIVGSYMIGHGPGKDENFLKWLSVRALLEPLDTLPFGGQILDKLAEGKQVDPRSAPEVSMVGDVANQLERLGHLAHDAINGNTTAAQNAMLMAQAAALGTFVWTGAVPYGQVTRTTSYLQQLSDHQTRPPRGVLDVASGVMSGPQKKDSSDIYSGLEDLFSGGGR